MSGSIAPQPGVGGSPPSPGASGPGSPPIGSSPATGPSQNLGSIAQGNQIAQAVLQMMAMALAKLPPGSPLAQSFSKSITDIGKHVEPGAASPQGVQNAMKNAMANQAQMAPHRAAMGAASPGGAPPPGMGGQPPPPPMPPPGAPQ